ncbi:uncharacterized protein LOC118478571 isoform X1 [Aplysia californica]|uniref:Uncharacterized protein LOC118478571 isoform X1 n=1 Tax=Aplysia californica TaxID=6500 RepID=A0ABM1W0Z1_APLCA|nr:uncharacterized protein LOC118478571 isoform X1 [Aplysia californica]
MNTLADEDDHQLDSMARNSLVLMEDRDGHETMRASLVFEEDSTELIKLIQSAASGGRGEEAPDDGLETPGRHSEHSHPHSHHHPHSQDKSYSSPRKMPEKLAKDIDNRIGSPLRNSSSGSPSKFVFKNRDSVDEKRRSKVVALGKPPIHASTKREKSFDGATGLASELGRQAGSTNSLSSNRDRESSLPSSKPKSILKDKNASMSERNSNGDNRFLGEASAPSVEPTSADGRVIVTMKDEPNLGTPREQSPRRPPGPRHAMSKPRESESASGYHIRRFSRQGSSSSASPRGYADARSLAMPEADGGPVPKPPPGHAPKNAVVSARIWISGMHKDKSLGAGGTSWRRAV